MDPGQWSTSAAELQSRSRSQSASTTVVATCIDISPWTFRLACPPEAWRVAGEIVHRVCSSVPNLALIDHGGLVHEPPPPKKKIKSKFTVFRLPFATACLPNLTRISYGGAVTGAPPRSRNYHLLFSWSTLPLTVQQAVFLFSAPGVAASITQSIMSHKTPFSTFHLIIFSL